MLKYNRFIICCFSIVFCFSNNAFSAKKSIKNLLKINKQIEDKKKTSNTLEKEQKKISAEIQETQKKMVKIAENVKKYEKQLSEFDQQLYSLKLKENILNDKIEENNMQLIKIIAVFENIALMPKGYLFVSHSKIDSIFNSSILLKTLVENLNNSKLNYVNDLNNLIKLKEDISNAKLSIYTLNNKVKIEKNKISDLIKSKKIKQRQITSEQYKLSKEIKKLVSESKSIEEFLKKAENLRKAKEKKSSTKISKTLITKNMQLQLPVDGKIKTKFGEYKTKGVLSKGIYIKPRQNSQVISPTDANVIFSGSFYGYKNLLILHTNDDLYIIMGGMNSIYADEGQSIIAGEPIGEMKDGEFYLEVRLKEKPVNPLNYFKI